MNDFIIKKRQTYYARLTIPSHLRTKLGKTAFVQSLQTRDIREANIKKHVLLAQWKNLIRTADNGKPLSELESALTGIRQDPNTKDVQEDVILGFEASEAQTYLHALEIDRGEDLLLAEHAESYLTSIKSIVAPKGIHEKRTALAILLTEYQTASQISRHSITLLVNRLLKDKAKATVAKMVSSYRVFWRYLEQANGIDLGDPFRDVLPKSGRKTKADREAERKAFLPLDILRLLEECPYSDLKHLITIAAYSGCRLEELCALKLTHVKDDRLLIGYAKTAAGDREVPIHKDLNQLVTRLVDTSTDGYLISGLTLSKFDDRSNAIGKRFGRLKKKLGYDNRYVFHSIRKTFASRLEEAGVPELLAARLLGHEVKTISYGLYSSGSTFPQLKEAINQVRY
jgi:integrase